MFVSIQKTRLHHISLYILYGINKCMMKRWNVRVLFVFNSNRKLNWKSKRKKNETRLKEILTLIWNVVRKAVGLSGTRKKIIIISILPVQSKWSYKWMRVNEKIGISNDPCMCMCTRVIVDFNLIKESQKALFTLSISFFHFHTYVFYSIIFCANAYAHAHARCCACVTHFLY